MSQALAPRMLPLLAAAGLWTMAVSAQAQTNDPNALLDQGQAAQACASLGGTTAGEDLDQWFARGRCAALSGDHEAAIAWFSKIVAIADAGRTRLELARSLAKAGRSNEARASYEAVLQAAPPPGIREWVLDEMSALDSTHRSGAIRWRFGLSPTYDSNVNVGPGTKSIVLFDLPFELNDSSVARADSGMTVSAGMELSRATPLGQLTLAASEQATFYRKAGFADLKQMSTSASLARPGQLAHWTWAVSMDRQSQRSGNRATSLVGSVQPFVPLGAYANVQWAVFMQADIGRVASRAAQMPEATYGTLRAVSPSLLAKLPGGMELLIGLRRSDEVTADPSRSHQDHGWQFSAQGRMALCSTCMWSLSQVSLGSTYGDMDPMFELVRSDRMQAHSFKIIRPAKNAQVATPSYTILVEKSRNQSNLVLYQYQRTRVGMRVEWTL